MFMSHRKIKFVAAAAVGAVLLTPVSAFSPQSIVITPTTFDFGWAPDNSKINAEFTLKNTGSDLVPLTSVQPTCGCTVPQFTPSSLGANDQTKVILTFNTRGYAGTGFSKNAKVKTDDSSIEYTVMMTGFVTDPNAKVIPDQGGVAGFPKDAKERSKKIKIENKSDKDVTLEIVQAPAAWAKVKLDATSIKAGGAAVLEVSIDGETDQDKQTSVTLSAKDDVKTSRLTVAIWTGQGPTPMRRPEVVPPPAPATENKSPAKPATKPATKSTNKKK